MVRNTMDVAVCLFDFFFFLKNNNSRLRRALFVPSVRRHYQKTNLGIISNLTIQVKIMNFLE